MLRRQVPKEKDYRTRLDILVSAGVLELPDLKQGKPARFMDRDAFDELSFLFFVAWLYTSIWNRDRGDFRASWVMVPGAARTILALGRDRHPFVLPGTTSKPPPLFIDDQFFRCEVDDTKVAVERKRQVLCPVLNRVRLNLGNSDPARIAEIPPSSSECCGSLKQKFRDFLEADLA
ncbi:MAG TPA: hypothetical protein VH165_09820, partial [Kofleriaceae bacterium]|nr:hypothetical protein [Kofleriaceae bacterium]